jgi:5'(3')-deoxyribonucleotidase
LDSTQGRGIKHITAHVSNAETEAFCNAWEFVETLHSYSYTYVVKGVYSDAKKVFDSKYFFDNVEFFPQAKEVVTKLINDERFEVIFCSIGTVKNISNKMEFLEKHFPNVTQIMIKNGQEMDKSLVNMNNAMFIDDNTDNLNSSNASINACFSYDNCLDKEWNIGWGGILESEWIEIYDNLNQLVAFDEK